MGGLPNELIADRNVATYPQTEGSQIDDHRLSMSCGVVERADHHCGDDLVMLINLCLLYFSSKSGTSESTRNLLSIVNIQEIC